MSARIVLLPGDGVGPEVTAGAVVVLAAAAARFGLAIAMEECAFGGAAIDAAGEPAPAETIGACCAADAVFLGAVGGPKWDRAPIRPEAGLLALRRELGVFANLRPVRMIPGMEAHSPLKPELATGVDLLIVRELTGGVYFGAREEHATRASDVCAYSEAEIARVARVAFEAAAARRGRVTSVDKANVLATSRLWRRVVEAVAAEYPAIELRHQLVDSMAMKLLTEPAAFDVVLTENMFGDILSDEASAIGGSIGLSPSASLGAGGPGLYEPVHGSAPDIAGRDIANPIGAILSAAMLLRMSLGASAAADAVTKAVESALAAGFRTRDLGGETGCEAMAAEIASRVAEG